MIAYPSKFLSIELSGRGEQDRSSGHVQSHTERFRGEQRLDQPFAEEDLDGFLDDRQQSGVMDADTFLQQRQDRVDLRKFLVFIREKIDGVVEHFFDKVLLVFCKNEHVGRRIDLGENAPELKSSLAVAQAYVSQSFLLKLKTITGAKFRSMIIFTILKTLVSATCESKHVYLSERRARLLTFETTASSAFVAFGCVADVTQGGHRGAEIILSESSLNRRVSVSLR